MRQGDPSSLETHTAHPTLTLPYKYVFVLDLVTIWLPRARQANWDSGQFYSRLDPVEAQGAEYIYHMASEGYQLLAFRLIQGDLAIWWSMQQGSFFGKQVDRLIAKESGPVSFIDDFVNAPVGLGFGHRNSGRKVGAMSHQKCFPHTSKRRLNR